MCFPSLLCVQSKTPPDLRSGGPGYVPRGDGVGDGKRREGGGRQEAQLERAPAAGAAARPAAAAAADGGEHDVAAAAEDRAKPGEGNESSLLSSLSRIF